MMDFTSYVIQCAPNVAVSTMQAIIKTESRGNYLAINLNKNRLLYQPKSYQQAVSWVNYLEAHEYNFDIGLAQINIKNVHKAGYRAYQVLDPCINLKLAGQILQKNYNQAKHSSTNTQNALFKAISAYNTGNYKSGFNNGYVNKVIGNAYAYR